MKPRKTACALVFSLLNLTSLLLCTHAQAAWLLEPEFNAGSLKLSEKLEFSPGESHENSLSAYALGVQGGFEFANHVFIKAGLTSGETENLLGWQDRIKFYDAHVSSGVQWPVSPRVSLLAALGVSNWDYYTKDQASFEANQPDKHYSGSGLEYRAGLNFRFNRLLSMDIYAGGKDWGDYVRYEQYGLSLCFRFE